MSMMRDDARENLVELLRRFMDDSAARAAQEDVQAGERILQAHPAPAPSPAVLARIRVRMMEASLRRQRRIRMIRGAAAVAAVLVLTVLIGLQNRGPGTRANVSFASIIPAALWESDDLAVDDLDLVYFTSEIRQIESQMQALEAGEIEIRGSNTLDELEMEMIALETEFWKG